MVSALLKCTQDWRPGTFSAVPSGLFLVCHLYPGLTSWATLSRPFGTQLVSGVLRQNLKSPCCLPGSSAGVPRPRTPHEPSNKCDCEIWFQPYSSVPRTGVLGHFQPSLRDCSWFVISTQDCDVLGYSQPSLRDCSWLSFLPRTDVLGY